MTKNIDDEDSQIIIHSDESLDIINGLPFKQPINIIIEDLVFDKIHEHVEKNLQIEMGGVIVGRLYSSSDIIYVEATDIIEIDQPNATFASLKFDHDTWVLIDKKKNNYFPDLRIVGWYHSHLGLGIFYSVSDISVHKIAFPERWQFGIVVDPINENQGVFTWGENQKITQSNFLLSKSIRSSQPLQHNRSDLFGRIQLLKSYTAGIHPFNELQPYLTDIITNLKQLANSSKKLGYPHLSEITKLLRYSNIQSPKIKNKLIHLDQFLGQEYYLSLEMLQVCFAALPKNTSLVAIGDWAYALIQNKNIFAINSSIIDNKENIRFIEVPWKVQKIFSLNEEIIGIDNDGNYYKFVHNMNKLGQDNELEGMMIGTVNKLVWQNIGGINGVNNICALKNDIVVCQNNNLYGLASLEGDNDHFSLEPLNFVHQISSIKKIKSDENGNLYIFSSNNEILKIDDHDKTKWTISSDQIIDIGEFSFFTIYNTYVVILDSDKMYLYFFDTQKGKYLRRYRLTSWLISRGINDLFSSQEALYISSESEVYRLEI